MRALLSCMDLGIGECGVVNIYAALLGKLKLPGTVIA